MARQWRIVRSGSYDPQTWVEPAEPHLPAPAPRRGSTLLLCLASAALLAAGAAGAWVTREPALNAATAG
ncbi:MAG: hypothetical protein ABW203_05385 [Novosphingobium sp.]